MCFIICLDTPHLKGLDNLVEDFLILNKQKKSNNFFHNDRNNSMNNSMNISKMNMNTHSTIVFYLRLFNFNKFSQRKQMLILFSTQLTLIWPQRKTKQT